MKQLFTLLVFPFFCIFAIAFPAQAAEPAAPTVIVVPSAEIQSQPWWDQPTADFWGQNIASTLAPLLPDQPDPLILRVEYNPNPNANKFHPSCTGNTLYVPQTYKSSAASEYTTLFKTSVSAGSIFPRLTHELGHLLHCGTRIVDPIISEGAAEGAVSASYERAAETTPSVIPVSSVPSLFDLLDMPAKVAGGKTAYDNIFDKTPYGLLAVGSMFTYLTGGDYSSFYKEMRKRIPTESQAELTASWNDYLQAFNDAEATRFPDKTQVSVLINRLPQTFVNGPDCQKCVDPFPGASGQALDLKGNPVRYGLGYSLTDDTAFIPRLISRISGNERELNAKFHVSVTDCSGKEVFSADTHTFDQNPPVFKVADFPVASYKLHVCGYTDHISECETNPDQKNVALFHIAPRVSGNDTAAHMYIRTNGPYFSDLGPKDLWIAQEDSQATVNYYPCLVDIETHGEKVVPVTDGTKTVNFVADRYRAISYNWKGRDQPYLYRMQDFSQTDHCRDADFSPATEPVQLYANSWAMACTWGAGFSPRNWAQEIPFPARLGTTELELKDSAGTVHKLPLVFSDQRETRFIIPPDIASGPAEVRVVSDTARSNAVAVKIIGGTNK